MTSPQQINRAQQPGRWTTGQILAIILIPLATMALGCLGLCGGILFLGRARLQSAVERTGIDIRDITPEPQTDWNDWMVRRELTHFYQTALDSVMADKALGEKLGEPIETALESDDLFRRRDKGSLNPRGEHIEFDVRGPKGTGKVAVVSTPPRADGIQPDGITVTLSDGTHVNVKPIHRPLPQVR